MSTPTWAKLPTAAQLRLLRAIDQGEKDQDGSGIRGRELATRLWPDSPGWKRVYNCGPNGATAGAAMPRTAGCLAGKLSTTCRKEEPWTAYLGWRRGWTLTSAGRRLARQEQP